MREYTWAVMLAIAVGTQSGAVVSAQKGGSSKQTATELRTTFRDDPSDAVRSDGSYYETDSQLKTSNTLTATGAANFMLNTFTARRGTAVRCLVIDLSAASVMALADGAVLPTGGCVVAEITSLSFFTDDKDSLRNMTADQLVVKRVAIGWQEGDMQYHLRFKGQPVDLGDGNPHQLANLGFTCVAADAAGCVQWAAEPVRCDVAASGGPYSTLTNCGANRQAVLERRSLQANTAPEMLAVLDVPLAMTILRR